MTYVLSLIAAESKAPLHSDVVDEARRLLEDAGASIGTPDWLAPDEACDIHFEGDCVTATDCLRPGLQPHPIDVNILNAKDRRKRLLLADMDSTMIQQECIDELADFVGAGPEVAAITERAMRGEIDFEPALRARVRLLKGLSTEAVAQILAERITLMPGAQVLLATMVASGAYTALISGGFTAFTAPIAERLAFHEHRANTLDVEAGAFTGNVLEPVNGPAAKDAALLELAARLGISPTEVLAVGDGANDAAMVKRAGLGVAYRAKPALRTAADAIVDHGDLTALLFLQGYRREEFVLRLP